MIPVETTSRMGLNVSKPCPTFDGSASAPLRADLRKFEPPDARRHLLHSPRRPPHSSSRSTAEIRVSRRGMEPPRLRFLCLSGRGGSRDRRVGERTFRRDSRLRKSFPWRSVMLVAWIPSSPKRLGRDTPLTSTEAPPAARTKPPSPVEHGRSDSAEKSAPVEMETVDMAPARRVFVPRNLALDRLDPRTRRSETRQSRAEKSDGRLGAGHE
jgi:hypothetical protein